MKIWVDDLRPRPSWDWIHASSSTEAIMLLENHRTSGEPVEIMSLDHDLGGEDTTRPVVLWMVENDFWPVEVKVHSQNPIGVTWLQGMVDRYHPSNAHKYTR